MRDTQNEHEYNSVMNIVLFGPQGSGKGTQARLLCERFGFFYFESGAYLRKVAETNEIVKKALDDGILDEEINKEMASYLTAFFDQEKMYDNIVFDGFLRTTEQYDFFKNWLNARQVKIDLAVVLEISEEETIKRLMLRKREDDTPEVIKERLSLYQSQTEPLISKMSKDVRIVRVDGERSIEDIQKDLIDIVEKFQNGQD